MRRREKESESARIPKSLLGPRWNSDPEIWSQDSYRYALFKAGWLHWTGSDFGYVLNDGGHLLEVVVSAPDVDGGGACVSRYAI
ncbi:hypothetical protein L484_013301 [Morus notabilis]|uniref:Uncharacterized protein n=1 Tax=Morus notabilis TaxID=981085 RepID=W9QT68_9ROSA|nr:hypothetical protein L484_013301 [Morus notabilis]